MKPDLLALSPESPGPLRLVWPRYVGIGIAGTIIVALLSPVWWSASDGGTGDSLAPACANWDDRARDAIARRLQGSGLDAELRQAGDAIFMLRRARRSCETGWMVLACQDYLAVIRGGTPTAAAKQDRPGCTLATIEGAAH
jgi:hypothetical protein